MATVTRQIGAWSDNTNDTFTVTMDYDDVDLRIRAFHGDNRSPTNSATVSATDLSAARTYSKVCPPNVVTDQIVPTGQAQKLQLFINAAGKLDGVEWSVQFP